MSAVKKHEAAGVAPLLDQATQLLGHAPQGSMGRADFERVEQALQAFTTLLLGRLTQLAQVTPATQHGDTPQGNAMFAGILGQTPAISELREMLRKVAPTDAPVLITGENGTGKEGVARAIVLGSRRKDKPFLTVNCGALQDSLLESELFGHVKGAFTGAHANKDGFFSRADGGTLLLDEVGDTSLAMQVKLLRVLQEGTFVPVGGSGEQAVDVRILTATNRDLKAMIKKGSFREDFFFRLNVIPIHLPPLRKRKGDIPVLAQGLLRRHLDAQGVLMPKAFTSRVLNHLEAHHWPGNVRELENVIVRMLVFAGAETLLDTHLLPGDLRGESTEEGRPLELERGIEELMADHERIIVREALARHKGNMTAAATLLRLTQTGLKKKMDRLGIPAPARG